MQYSGRRGIRMRRRAVSRARTDARHRCARWQARTTGAAAERVQLALPLWGTAARRIRVRRCRDDVGRNRPSIRIHHDGACTDPKRWRGDSGERNGTGHRYRSRTTARPAAQRLAVLDQRQASVLAADRAVLNSAAKCPSIRNWDRSIMNQVGQWPTSSFITGPPTTLAAHHRGSSSGNRAP